MSHVTVNHNGNTPFSISHFFMALFLRCVSKHAKHIFFIASLHGQFNEYARHHRMAMSKLNQAMRLAHREEALSLPVAMRNKIWKGTGLEDVLTEQAVANAATAGEVRRLAVGVLRVAPEWARYGRLEEMVRDISDWICSQRDYMRSFTIA